MLRLRLLLLLLLLLLLMCGWCGGVKGARFPVFLVEGVGGDVCVVDEVLVVVCVGRRVGDEGLVPRGQRHLIVRQHVVRMAVVVVVVVVWVRNIVNTWWWGWWWWARHGVARHHLIQGRRHLMTREHVARPTRHGLARVHVASCRRLHQHLISWEWRHMVAVNHMSLGRGSLVALDRQASLGRRYLVGVDHLYIGGRPLVALYQLGRGCLLARDHFDSDR